MNPVVHFELPYNNLDKISKFYSTVFGWKLENLGKEFGNYVLATTAEHDAKPGAPSGTINGGFFPVKPQWPAQYPSIVIAVENIQDTMELIQKNGGTILGNPMDIPNFGNYVSFLDPEENRHSIIQPNAM